MIPVLDKNNPKKEPKGQIFTLDVLAAILGVTILLGVTVQYQTLIKDQTTETQHVEMRTMAEDASQIAVKRILPTENTVNTIGSDAEEKLESFLDDFTGEKYDYEVTGAIEINDCGEREQSNSKRLIKNQYGVLDTLTITVCPN